MDPNGLQRSQRTKQTQQTNGPNGPQWNPMYPNRSKGHQQTSTDPHGTQRAKQTKRSPMGSNGSQQIPTNANITQHTQTVPNYLVRIQFEHLIFRISKKKKINFFFHLFQNFQVKTKQIKLNIFWNPAQELEEGLHRGVYLIVCTYGTDFYLQYQLVLSVRLNQTHTKI